jgi:putative endonuclease
MGIFVYMLRCADNSFYVGSATGDDLAPRIDQHNAGAYPGYFARRRGARLRTTPDTNPSPSS